MKAIHPGRSAGRFCALGLLLGLVVGALGTWFLARGTPGGSDAEKARLEGELESLRGAKQEALAQLREMQGFSEAVFPVLVRGALQGREVLVVSEEGGDRGLEDAISGALDAAGAVRVGWVILGAKLGLTGAADREQLAEELGTRGTDPVQLWREWARSFASSLAAGREVTSLALPPFVQVRAGEGRRPGRDLALVLLGGPLPPGVLVSLVEELSRLGFPVVVGEGRGKGKTVAAVRGGVALPANVSTVDDLDTVMGKVALVWSLAELLSGRPGGNYGVGEGASGILPPPPEAARTAKP